MSEPNSRAARKAFLLLLWCVMAPIITFVADIFVTLLIIAYSLVYIAVYLMVTTFKIALDLVRVFPRLAINLSSPEPVFSKEFRSDLRCAATTIIIVLLLHLVGEYALSAIIAIVLLAGIAVGLFMSTYAYRRSR